MIISLYPPLQLYIALRSLHWGASRRLKAHNGYIKNCLYLYYCCYIPTSRGIETSRVPKIFWNHSYSYRHCYIDIHPKSYPPCRCRCVTDNSWHDVNMDWYARCMKILIVNPLEWSWSKASRQWDIDTSSGLRSNISILSIGWNQPNSTNRSFSTFGSIGQLNIFLTQRQHDQ
jgi:hypothetical protein